MAPAAAHMHIARAGELVIALRRARTASTRSPRPCPSPAAQSRLLRRAELHRLAGWEPAPPVNRYEHDQPGELLHLDQ